MEFDDRAFLQQLSPYELLELSFLVRNSITEDIAIFMTALFAYLGSAYLVGARLHKFQIAFASIAYSIFQILIVFSVVGLLDALGDITFVIANVEPNSLIVWATPILLVCVWIGSLVFAAQMRVKGHA